MENRDNPAFPLHPDSVICNENGLTKREYFAGLAMQGILSKKFDEPKENLTETISDAIEYADELLKQLEDA